MKTLATCIVLHNSGYAWSKKTKNRGKFFLKSQKVCSTMNQLSALLIKQPEEQEVA